jgi:hypothetical protein
LSRVGFPSDPLRRRLGQAENGPAISFGPQPVADPFKFGKLKPEPPSEREAIGGAVGKRHGDPCQVPEIRRREPAGGEDQNVWVCERHSGVLLARRIVRHVD